MHRFDRLLLLTAVGAILCSPALVRAENWPQFRGPTGQGLSAEKGLPVTWGGKNQENVLWTAPLKGNGTASPIVWDNRVFVCTATWPPDVKDHKSTFPQQHVQCYRTSDGQLLWDVEVPHGPWKPNDFRIGPSGGYAELTPVTDGKLVYCASARRHSPRWTSRARSSGRKKSSPATSTAPWAPARFSTGRTSCCCA